VTPAGIVLRAAHDGDGPGLLALVGRCFADYPGCVLDAVREEKGLRRPASSYPWFLVAEAPNGWIVGSIAGQPHRREDGSQWVELKKLYVHPAQRGKGLGRLLVERFLAHADELGAAGTDLWSDTRFETAHAVYERMGWVRQGQPRDLGDRSDTREHYFARPSPAGRPS